MKVEEMTQSVAWNVTIDGVDYVRWRSDIWCRYYGDSLEYEHGREKELEAAFKEAWDERQRDRNLKVTTLWDLYRGTGALPEQKEE